MIMLIWILFLVAGSIAVFLELNNFGPIVVSTRVLSVGLSLAFALYLFHTIFETFSIYKRDRKIKHGNSDITDLTKRIHQLEIENAKLKGPVDENAL